MSGHNPNLASVKKYAKETGATLELMEIGARWDHHFGPTESRRYRYHPELRPATGPPEDKPIAVFAPLLPLWRAKRPEASEGLVIPGLVERAR